MTGPWYSTEDCVGSYTGIKDVVFGCNNFCAANGLLWERCRGGGALDLEIEEITVGVDIAGVKLVIVRLPIVCIPDHVVACV